MVSSEVDALLMLLIFFQSLLTFAHTWAKALRLNVYISSQDVATAFDTMDHEMLKEAMLKAFIPGMYLDCSVNLRT